MTLREILKQQIAQLLPPTPTAPPPKSAPTTAAPPTAPAHVQMPERDPDVIFDPEPPPKHWRDGVF